MSQMLFYNNIIPLNPVQHKNARMRQVTDFSFAAATHFIPVSGMEFSVASKEFPIVFIKHADGGVSPIILVGLQENKNMFVSSEGKWLAGYLPAYVSRYPFVPSANDENSEQLAICVDDTCPDFNEKDGEPLFLEEGSPAPLLERVIQMLQNFHAYSNHTIDFCNRLAASGLLEEMKGEFGMRDGEKKIKLEGLYAVSEKKLLDLDDDTVLDYFRRGEFAWIYCHLTSLSNLPRMVDAFFSAQK